MNKDNIPKILFFMGFLLAIFSASAFAGTRTYDVTILLNQPHPYSESLRRSISSKVLNTKVFSQNLRPPVRIPENKPFSKMNLRPALNLGNTKPILAKTGGDAKKYSNFYDLISEVRLGILAHDHDLAPFSRSEENGIDGNFEILFRTPDCLEKYGSPRPHLGVSLNMSGDTSQVYSGLTWEWNLTRNWFFNFSLGASAHNGKTTTTKTDRKELGCRVLFRESMDIGYKFYDRHSVSAFFDHISNAKLCEKNEGLETLGLRYGYRF